MNPRISARHPSPVAECAQLSKTFGATRALDDVSLSIEAGEIRALVGRNGAGKSTLVSILTGMLAPDAGTVCFSGTPAPAPQERDLWLRRVACVYQHSKIIPTLSCAENLFLSVNASRRGLISWSGMRDRARAVLDEWGVALDVEAPASSLTVDQRQLLEIARALTQGSRFLVLDEPTAKLDGRAAERLFQHLRMLRAKGVGVLYISHHLDEIFEICETATVLRDGQRVMDRSIATLSSADLIDAMVGSARPRASNVKERAPSVVTPVTLDVRGLSSPPAFGEVTFKVHRGECVGLAGLTGCGKEAIGRVLAGVATPSSGAFFVDGAEPRRGDVARHQEAGIGFVPEDRHAEGLVLDLSVGENATMSISDQLGRFGFIRPQRLAQVAQRLIRDLGVKTHDATTPVSQLSGGNQQKVVLARALARNPWLLVLTNPTSGVDVASKASLLSAISAVANRGTAVLVISDELEELELCHRVLVMRKGRLTREFGYPWQPGELVAEMEGVAA